MWRQASNLLALTSAGLVAGIMAGTGLCFYAARTLEGECWTALFQQNDLLFEQVMRPVFLVGVLTLLMAAVIAQGQARIWFSVASVLFISAVLITLTSNVPINLLIRSWNPAMLPAGWQATRDRWLWFHLLRSISAFTGFIASVLGLMMTSRGVMHDPSSERLKRRQ